MTRKEAIAYFEARGNYNPHDGTNREAEKMALTALRGPTREMVERMRGEWRITVEVDTPDYHRNGPPHCAACGAIVPARTNFCPCCGQPKTDEAVDMMLERWKEAVDGETGRR